MALATRAGEGWEELTYGDLDGRSAAVAAALAGAGVGPGDRVALLAEPGGGWAVAFLGILRGGGIAVLLDAKLTDQELASLCQRSGLAAAVVSPALAGRWPDRAVPVLPPSTAASAWPDVPRAVDGPAVLVWTSGTTGEPRGVLLSLANLVYVIEQSSLVQGTGADARWLSVLPPNHLLELCCGLLPGLAAGATTFVARSIVPSELCALIAECRATHMVAVPLVLRLLRRHLAPSGEIGPLRTIYCGGAPLDPHLVTYFGGLGVAVHQGYGLTEAAPVVSMNSPTANRAGSVGRPLPGTTVRIGDAGEILVRGPGVMLGYWEDEAATREAVDAGGWLHTGDLGRLDDDGYLYVTGRSKSIIVLESGKKVQPEEVEAVLSGGERFAEVCVVGWRAAGAGEQVTAVVVPDEPMTEEEAAAEVRRLSVALSGFKRPTIVRVHEGELPKTVKRSMRRAEVVRWLEQR